MDNISDKSLSYNHKNLVNNPPFITNYPLLRPVMSKKQEFKENELDLFHKEHNKQKTKNFFLWGSLITTTTACYIYGKSFVTSVKKYILKK